VVEGSSDKCISKRPLERKGFLLVSRMEGMSRGLLERKGFCEDGIKVSAKIDKGLCEEVETGLSGSKFLIPRRIFIG
jgi:hypothetical protein